MRPMDKVIGYKNIKEELYRLIDVLKNPSKYQRMGVEEPKGLMLIGDPGIGKSLLAECIDVNSEFIAKILDNESCATLKNVINEAGIRAAYNSKDKIEMDDILHTCLRVIYKAPECLENANYDYVRNIAYHEAGHAVIKEVLEPGTVNIVTVLKCEGDIGGITSSSQDKNYYNDIDFMDNKVLTLLGGKAAIELKYGKIDTGCTSDIDRAFNIVERTTKDFAGYSFMCHDELSLDDNWAKKNKQRIMAFKMEEYYSKAKRILVENNDLLEKMADLLVEKKIITYLDIQVLKNDLR